jgi:uncharacterized protein YecE (DUF72 family)
LRITCDVRIRTSGFHYKHWKGPFYPPKIPDSKLLAYYVQHFDTVELNNSFYRLPTAEAFDAWRNATPNNFLFAVKASRFIVSVRPRPRRPVGGPRWGCERYGDVYARQSFKS